VERLELTDSRRIDLKKVSREIGYGAYKDFMVAEGDRRNQGERGKEEGSGGGIVEVSNERRISRLIQLKVKYHNPQIIEEENKHL